MWNVTPFNSHCGVTVFNQSKYCKCIYCKSQIYNIWLKSMPAKWHFQFPWLFPGLPWPWGPIMVLLWYFCVVWTVPAPVWVPPWAPRRPAPSSLRAAAPDAGRQGLPGGCRGRSGDPGWTAAPHGYAGCTLGSAWLGSDGEREVVDILQKRLECAHIKVKQVPD